MVLSDEKKFLFIHIPKTAGTSIQHVLEPYGVTEPLAYSRGLERYITVEHQFPPHLRYADAAAALTVDLRHFFKFTFVRNPWDRLVSMYEYFRKDTQHAMHRRCVSCSFEEFVDDVAAGRATFDTMNQIEYVKPPAGLGPLDFIGKVENIAADFAFVCRKIGIANAELPVLNATRHDHYRSYYSEPLKKKVEALCALDIRVFGYSF